MTMLSARWVILACLALGWASVSAVAAPDLGETLRGTLGFEPAVVPPAATAATDLSVSLLPGLPDLKVRTMLVAVHLIGLCFGLGGVLVLDILLAKAVIRGAFFERNINMVWILSRTTMAGLTLLWASGIGFLMLYAHDQPALLANPKIVAKVAIVAALTVNGFVIHSVCLPRFMADIDQPPLVSMPPVARMLMLFCGVLSGVSWYAATFLGAAKEFNGTVPAETLLVLWAGMVMMGFVVTTVALKAWIGLRGRIGEVDRQAPVAGIKLYRAEPLSADEEAVLDAAFDENGWGQRRVANG